MRTNAGADRQAEQMATGALATSGTATAVAATSVTNTAATWTVNQWIGSYVTLGGMVAIVLSNTSTILTIDRWYAPTNMGSATAAGTPAVGAYVILPGCASCSVIAMTANATAPVTTDTALTGEITTAGSGLLRKMATYSHTSGTSTYTLAATFTLTSSDTQPTTPAKSGIFDSMVPVTGTMQYEDLLPSPAPMLTGDTVTPTYTISM